MIHSVREEARASTRRATSAHFVIACVLAAILAAVAGEPRPPHVPVVLMLAAMALLAECLPVRFHRNRVPVTLGLPFIAGTLIEAGALVAGTVALFAFGLPEIAQRAQREGPIDWVETRRRILTGTTIVLVAGSAVGEIFRSSGAGASPIRMLEALAFVLLYGVMDQLLQHGREAAQSPMTRYGGHTLVWLRYGLFTLLAVQVAVLARDEFFVFIPVTFVPVLLLRRALELRARLYEHHEESMITLSLMLQRTHEYSRGHLERVASMAEEVGLALGLSPRRARFLREAAMLHDIGKIAIDERILEKPAPLTENEFAQVRRHAEFGARILEQAERFRPIAAWIRHHHERPDGKGYPDGLIGDQTPIESRIIAVTDAFDAMVGGPNPGDRRSYRKHMSPSEAYRELERCAGTQFDAQVVGAFGAILRSRGYLT